AEGIVGMERGGEREFTVEVPEDSPQKPLAGKTVTYHVRIHEVKEENLPELNDEFASQVGEGFPSMEALRQRLQDDARARLAEAAQDRNQEKALDALVAGATVEYPAVLVDREIEALLRDRMPPGDQRQAMQRYLAQVGKSETEIKDELRPAATKRLLRSLVLAQFADAEQIEVAPEEVDAEIDRLAGGVGGAADQLREYFSSETGKRGLANSLRTHRAFDRLGEIAAGEAIEAPPAVGGEPAQPPDDAVQPDEPPSEAAAATALDEAAAAPEPAGSVSSTPPGEEPEPIVPAADESAAEEIQT
ncbi:MAG TPA: hypothetical protein VND24_00450, partial [Steroidobacteraceae bacterium]|nr:hypothetical protein [Steroidobacteraceae bacterium]